MNRWGRVVLAFLGLFAVGQARAERSLTAEVLRISDGTPVIRMEFRAQSENPAHLSAQTVLKLDFSGFGATPSDLRNVRRERPALSLFTVNGSGPSGPRNGLHNADKSRRLPLYWRAFAAPQEGGVPFNDGNLGEWIQVRDPGDPDWNQTRAQAALPVVPEGRLFIYMGTVAESLAADDEFRTSLVIESFVAFAQHTAVNAKMFNLLYEIEQAELLPQMLVQLFLQGVKVTSQ